MKNNKVNITFSSYHQLFLDQILSQLEMEVLMLEKNRTKFTNVNSRQQRAYKRPYLLQSRFDELSTCPALFCKLNLDSHFSKLQSSREECHNVRYFCDKLEALF